MTEQRKAETMSEAPERIEVTYTNWKGVTSVRKIVPQGIRFAATEWHPEPQWLLRAWDDDRQAWRDFALKDFNFKADKRATTDDQAKVIEAAKDWQTARAAFNEDDGDTKARFKAMAEAEANLTANLAALQENTND